MVERAEGRAEGQAARVAAAAVAWVVVARAVAVEAAPAVGCRRTGWGRACSCRCDQHTSGSCHRSLA